jgi:threonine/homoserine/homoserine lactone efflux protein
MIPADRFAEFAGLAALVIAIPGPSVLFTISRALTGGRRTALLNVLGNELGLVVQVVAVAFGVGRLVEDSARAFTAVKLVGAAYLVFLGVQAVRHRRALAEAVGQRVRPQSSRRAIADGFVVGVSNPKSIAFFVVALPQFTEPSLGNLTVQLLLLGALFPLIAVVLDTVWALVAGAAGQWLAASPRRLAAIGGAGGLVMIGLGIGVAATGRKD